ncbi:MAG: ComEC/Rec2 family competence protein [Candidatus Paceibacterota bacterium]|jgi:competence protein ComEC
MGNQVSDKSFYIFVAGFISAIFISSFIKVGFSFFILLLVLGIFIFIYIKYFLINIENKKYLVSILIFVFSFSLGVLRFEVTNSFVLDSNLESIVGQKVSIKGIAIDEPQKKENFNELTVNFLSIGSSTKVYGVGLVQIDFYPEFKYGDLLEIKGKLEKPENIEKEDGREFDYVSYLGKDGVNYKINSAKAVLISSGNGNFLKAKLFDIKNAFTKNLERVISEPQASLLGGILLGSKSSMSADVKKGFQVSGLSHIVALSGYNITIVAESIMNTLSFLPKAFAFSGGILGIIFFVIMSGASSTAVRASVMSLIVILAQMTRRDYKIGRSLAVAAMLMIIYNPKILVFDISFQLSFLATVAIVFVSPIIKERLGFITERFGLRETVSGTISAQFLVLPLILYKIGMLSFVALPANVLVVSVIPFLMFVGFFTGILGFISLIISLPFAWVSWFLLTYILKVSDFFAGLPFSSANIPGFSVSVLVLLYVLIFFFLKYLKNK